MLGFNWLKKFKIPRPTAQGMRTAALFLAAPMFGGLLAWQLYTLDPKSWCKAAYDVAKADGAGQITAYRGCLDLQAIILNIKDHAIIGLLCVLGLGYIMMLMRELRMQGEFKGPLGIGGNFRSQDDHDRPATPAEGAQVAQEAVAEVVEDLQNQERG